LTESGLIGLECVFCKYPVTPHIDTAKYNKQKYIKNKIYKNIFIKKKREEYI
jgi:hypothetical protein